MVEGRGTICQLKLIIKFSMNTKFILALLCASTSAINLKNIIDTNLTGIAISSVDVPIADAAQKFFDAKLCAY